MHNVPNDAQSVSESWIKDPYVLPQVTLYILAVIICIQGCFQLIAAIFGLGVLPVGTGNPAAYRIVTFVIPGLQNLLVTAGAVTLASQLNTCSVVVWRIAVVVLAAEALFSMLGVWAQFNIVSALMLVLAGSGLVALLRTGPQQRNRLGTSE
ncbi:hypothetical protein LMG19083_00714 [Ralstonia psammae]|uniref:Transmembrane protein n=2 Tax=Ralstonia psammae TaxID=3058598 RepID=A0ABN9IF76_9RALS|nr:hypothetical protein LMG19083_00714 [Ralstonia sp. LMG 19083]